MLIVCPSCATSYEIGAAALGESGRSVKCAHCKSTWFATPAAALAAAEAAADRAPRADDAAEPAHSAFDELAVPGSRLEELTPDEAPSIAPAQLPPAPQPAPIEAEAPDAPQGIETVAARRARRLQAERMNRPGLARRLASAPVAIFVLLVVIAGLLQARDKVVRHVPQMASLFAAIGMPVNLRGLVFNEVVSRVETSEGVPVLIIEGVIVNVTTKTLDVPRLRFSLRNAAGHEVYAWSSQPPKPTVGSGNGLAFRTRLASPPSDGKDVIVRFFTRRDVTAGLQ